MKINKITTGFVVQVFDTKTKRFVSQEFIAGDETSVEYRNGETVPDGKVLDANATYLPFDMVQPAKKQYGVGVYK